MALRGRKKKEAIFEEIGNIQVEEQTLDNTSTQDAQLEAENLDNTSTQDAEIETEKLDNTSTQDTKIETEKLDNTSTQDTKIEAENLDNTSTQEKQHVGHKPLQAKQRTIIHLVDGEKGGVGKSLVARTMLQYCLDNSLPIVAVEADRSNPDVAGIYSDCFEAVFSEDEKRADKADKIFELAMSKSVIVNLPAQVYEPVSDWINKNGLIELGKQHSLTFCKWFVCTGGYDSVQLFLKSVKDFGDKMPHVLVRNLGLCDDWSHVEGMEEVNNTINKYSVQVIDFPKFSYRERNMVDEKRITFAQARDSDEFGIVSKQRIHNFLKSAYAQFKNTGLLP
jgi:adhesin HecA-like repeat protein